MTLTKLSKITGISYATLRIWNNPKSSKNKLLKLLIYLGDNKPELLDMFFDKE